MSFSTSEQIPVEVTRVEAETSTYSKSGWLFKGGPFKSLVYESEALLARAIKGRFPNGVVTGFSKETDGKRVGDVWPDAVPAEPQIFKAAADAGAVPDVPKGKVTNPHVFVKGADGYCLMCDNAEGNPIHVAGQTMSNGGKKKDAAATPAPSTPPSEVQESLW